MISVDFFNEAKDRHYNLLNPVEIRPFENQMLQISFVLMLFCESTIKSLWCFAQNTVSYL